MNEKVLTRETVETSPTKTTSHLLKDFPEIVTETETTVREETTREEKTLPPEVAPGPTITALTKIISVTTTKIRTTTPYTGTL